MTYRIGQRFGNYRLTQFLGEGGFAAVYLAEHMHLNTPAAIKILATKLSSPEMEQFRHEAYLLAHLDHPNIVRMLDFGLEETEKLPFLVMQYASRGTLRQRHTKGEIVPLETVLSYIKPVAAALQYAHDNQIIHRDVKPENMLINEHDDILLSDFGIALLAQNSLQQKTQEISGTASYIAPEQLQGKPRSASDQYALGIVVYEWLCGTCPFHGSFAEICAQHLVVPPPPLRQKVPTLSSEVEAVVEKALAKDPKQRFRSVQEFAMAFTMAAEGSATKVTEMGLSFSTSMKPGEEIDKYQTTVVETRTQQKILEAQYLPAQPKKRRGFLVGMLILTFLLIIGGSGIFATETIVQNGQIRAHATATTIAQSATATGLGQTATATGLSQSTSVTATATAQFVSSIDFTIQEPKTTNITFVRNDASFSKDHSLLVSSQGVTVAFLLQPDKKNVVVSLRALVSQDGPNIPGFAPINLLCNNQVIVANYTMPGNGASPSTTSFQIPGQQLAATNNQIQLQVASNAQTSFWLYRLEIVQTF